MKRSLATLLAIATITSATAGCFPHNKKHRRIAIAAEAGVTVVGIAVLATANTGADCKFLDEDCKSGASTGSIIGVGLLLAGIGGLVTTISTAESSREKPLPPLPTAEAEPAPAATPAPVAAPAPAAPPTPPADPSATPPAPTPTTPADGAPAGGGAPGR